MSMPSGLSTRRRIPKQERGERKVAQLLEAAASVFASSGYDGATMTAIAEQAGTSIGAVYQYFPNKEAIVSALRMQYASEMEQHWLTVDEETEGFTIQQLASRLVEGMSGFVDTHPAYFAVLDAPIKIHRSREKRIQLRERVASLFTARKPSLSHEQAFRMANVSMQFIKSLRALYAEADEAERRALVTEYKLALSAYLQARLR